MLTMKYIGCRKKYDIKFERISANIVQLLGDFPAMDKGFTLSRIGKDDSWSYAEFTTIYRKIDGGIQFSNNGSVWVEPSESELESEFIPIPMPEPYIPSIEEIRKSKKQEINFKYREVTTAGIDVSMSTGVQHFPLTDEDRSFLMGKQIELASGATEVSYQDSEYHCMLLSREDMQAIITAALSFVNAQTTYRNNLYEWIDKCETPEEVDAIAYGVEIPAKYQSEAYKRSTIQEG